MASIAARTAAVVVGRGMSAGAGGLATATPLHAAAAVGVRAMSTVSRVLSSETLFYAAMKRMLRSTC